MKKSSVVSITMPKEMRKVTEDLARQENRTMSELIREALRQYTTYSQFKQLQRYGKAQAKKLGLKPSDVQRIMDEARSEEK